jgi:CheY-like chemotaxis protein
MTELSGLRLLVVEDELLVALALEDILTDFGCELVGPVSRIEEAEPLAESEALDGAVLDVNVRGRNITSVVERLRARQIPVVICSGYSETTGLPSLLHGLPQVSKPYDKESLRRALAKAFRGHDPADQAVAT